MKASLAITTTLAVGSGQALAHGGHGHWASFAHDYEHGLAALAIGLVLSLGLGLLKRAKQNN